MTSRPTYQGSDRSPDDDHEYRLQALVEGQRLGWLDQGPIDNLDNMGVAPRLHDQFFLHTLPLPEAISRGKRDVEVTILSMGRIWAYGQQDNFFYHQVTDSRGVYRLYTHTDPYFAPDRKDASRASRCHSQLSPLTWTWTWVGPRSGSRRCLSAVLRSTC